MNKILIYDPPMCCSSGVCGPTIDPTLTIFASMLTQLEKKGVKVERYNLSQQPTAFAEKPEVRSLLEKEGTEILPLIFIDGALEMKGRYPKTDEREDLLNRATEKTATPTG